MFENIKDSIVTDEELLFIIGYERDIIKSYCEEEKPQNIPPIIKVLNSEKRLQFIPFDGERDFNRSTERRSILMDMGAAFYKEWGQDVFPSILIMISEAWMKSFDAKDVPDKVRAPSDYPDAIDSIVVQAITLTKSSLEETEAKPRGGLSVLEIKSRDPYLILEELVEPNLMPATRETTDLLNHFFMGWAKQGAIENNN